MKLPLSQPKPDIDNFIGVVKGEIVPKRPPLVELFCDYEIVREISTSCLGREWVDPGESRESREAYYRNWIEVYHRMGYDYVRVSGGIDFPGKSRLAEDTAEVPKAQRAWAEEGTGPIASWQDFEEYPWPDLDKIDLSDYEFVARNLPEGMGLFVCPASGFLEIPLDTLLGYENLCYQIYDNPDLLAATFQKTGELIYGFYEKLIGLPNLRGFFQGDDMGYKTGTMIGAADLRKYSLPWHKKLAELAHRNDLVYLLHSCGHLNEIMEDLIEDVKIDGRHSYEDEGNSVLDSKEKYGDRVAILGGIDVDKLCRLPEDELRSHVRRTIEACLPGGRYALGSGNTVTNYVPLKNYFIMVEEGLSFAG